MINAHIHLDLQNVIDNTIDNLGIAPSVGKQNWDVVARYKYFALGIHPWNIKSHTQQDLKYLERKIQDLHPIAIGEIGLDFHKNIHKNTNKYIQINCFKKQLNLAKKYNLPVIIHCVKSYDTVYSILKDYQLKVQIHGFNGSDIQGQKLLNIGCCLSFGLYKKSLQLQSFIAKMPCKNLLIETDEQPHSSLITVATELAALKNISVNELINTTNINAQQLFNLEIN